MTQPTEDRMDEMDVRERDLSTQDLVQAGDREDRPSTADIADPPRRDMREETAPQNEAPLFPAEQAERLRDEWTQVQTGFVDDPRRAVQDADGLIATSMKHLAETFSQARADLESQWDRGEDVSTEDLRLALQRYRAFFGRLLAV